eukprot:CAMPEP_0185162546 /NCGR_PEP_ID=MMETSP1139-20130426/6648_1 /TAXON_ID=298111 /ORGANISM="Pavlova sp., Strain CCMP459" /LENGTH=346 /DNA_ID=CAMNT_0027727873 /DNA_START=82 /DNA_END=1122 /DNA_ORIENTATION=-
MSEQHSGTHFLRSLLNRVPGFYTLGEILNPSGSKAYFQKGADRQRVVDGFLGFTALGEEIGHGSLASNHTELWERCFVNGDNELRLPAAPRGIWDRPRLTQLLRTRRAVGFIWQHKQGWWDTDGGGWGDDQRKWLDYLKARCLRVVMLQRTNLIAQKLSSNALAAPATANAETRTRVMHISEQNKKEFVGRPKRYETVFDHLKQAGIPAMWVTYEQMKSEGGVQTLRQMLHFLGETDVHVEGSEVVGSDFRVGISTQTKHHKEPPKAYIANPGQVRLQCRREFACFHCMLLDNCPFQEVRFGIDPRNWSCAREALPVAAQVDVHQEDGGSSTKSTPWLSWMFALFS